MSYEAVVEVQLLKFGVQLCKIQTFYFYYYFFINRRSRKLRKVRDAPIPTPLHNMQMLWGESSYQYGFACERDILVKTPALVLSRPTSNCIPVNR